MTLQAAQNLQQNLIFQHTGELFYIQRLSVKFVVSKFLFRTSDRKKTTNYELQTWKVHNVYYTCCTASQETCANFSHFKCSVTRALLYELPHTRLLSQRAQRLSVTAMKMGGISYHF